MRTSDALGKIAPALVRALGAIEGARKDSKNPHFKSSYASLENVIEASKDVLAQHGLGLMQFPGRVDGNKLGLETVIIHESGEWLTGDTAFDVVMGKQDAQGVGSALTYARRYAQMSALNMPAVDDDGEAAMPRNAPQKPPQKVAQAAISQPLDPDPVKETTMTSGRDWYGIKPEHAALSAYAAKNEGLGDKHEDFRAAIAKASSRKEWEETCRTFAEHIIRMPTSWRIEARSEADAVAEELGFDPTRRA